MHHDFVRHIAIGKNDLFGFFLLNKLYQVAFGVDRDAGWITRAGQLSGIGTTLDIRDLGSGEGNNIVVGVIPKEHVEVVEIAPCGAHDDGADGGH